MNLCEFNELMDTISIGQLAWLVLYTRGNAELRNLPWVYDKGIDKLFTKLDARGRPKMPLQLALWFEEYAEYKLCD